MSYDTFKKAVQDVLRGSGASLTWTEIKAKAELPQKAPNNKWVRALEKDIGLVRERQRGRGVLWRLKE